MPEEIAIWAVEAAIVDEFGEGLSPPVAAAVDRVVGEVLEFLEPDWALGAARTEAAAVLGRVLLGDADRLVQNHAGGGVWLVGELVGRESEERSIDRRHPIDRPVLCGAVDVPVDLVEMSKRPDSEALRPAGQSLDRVDPELVGSIQRHERPFPRLERLGSHALVRYSPVRVSTLIRSPVSTKSGTCTSRPVSSVTGFVAPDTVFPFTAGSA